MAIASSPLPRQNCQRLTALREIDYMTIQVCGSKPGAGPNGLVHTRRGRRSGQLIAFLLLSGLLAESCARRSPLNVAVVFTTAWTFAGSALLEEDRFVVKDAALVTLRHAFDGFAVRFAETPTGGRTVLVEDTPYATNASDRLYAAGLTYPLSVVSRVRIDVLFKDELAAIHCSALQVCGMPTHEVLHGLGRGVGATAAHELGHQVGFAVDTACDDCYEGGSATSYAHFFSEKHWSDRVIERMKQVLPQEAPAP